MDDVILACFAAMWSAFYFLNWDWTHGMAKHGLIKHPSIGSVAASYMFAIDLGRLSQCRLEVVFQVSEAIQLERVKVIFISVG